MKENTKYLTVSDDDFQWGFYLKVAGYSVIKPGSPYPSIEHPSGYYFRWEEGRILQEYQINYITAGEGIFENEFVKTAVKPGSIILTFPGIWHRYKPVLKKGWEENFIGFNGSIADILMNQSVFSPKEPILQIGIKEELIDIYRKIFDLTQNEQPAYQQIASGNVIKLMGYILSFEKQKAFTGKRITKIIDETRFTIRQNIEKEIDFKKLAQTHNIGYSHFRQMFKKFTGVSPGQYHLQLKLIRAKEMLLSTDKSIKEISNELGFQSIYYFSNYFRKKEGISPSSVRK